MLRITDFDLRGAGIFAENICIFMMFAMHSLNRTIDQWFKKKNEKKQKYLIQ